MANVDTKRFMDRCRINLPGALDTVLQLEFFAVMKDFLTTSEIWYEDVQFNVSVTTDNPTLSPDSFTYIVNPAQGGSFTRLFGVVDSGGANVKAFMPVIGSIILAFSPNTAQTYMARLAKTVTDPVTNDNYPVFPQWIMNKYGNEIFDGVVGMMMSQIAKPYSNPTMGAFHMRKFRGGVSQARSDARRGNLFSAQSWSFPQNFARSKAGAFSTR